MTQIKEKWSHDLKTFLSPNFFGVFSTRVPSVFVYNQGKEDYPVVFGQLTFCDGSFLFGREEKANFSYDNLKGKEILAGRRGGLPAMTLEYVLNKKGLFDGENITLNYDVAFNMMAGAFESGTGDYTTLFEPTASDFEENKKGNILASIGKDSGSVPYTCFVATKSFLEKNPETSKAFLKAVYRGIEFMEKNDSKVVAEKLLPAFSGSSVEHIQFAVESYLEIGAWKKDFSMTKDSFDRLQDIMTNAGELSTRADFDKLIFNDYSDEIGK